MHRRGYRMQKACGINESATGFTGKELARDGDMGFDQGCYFCFGWCFVFLIEMECFGFRMFWPAVSGLYSLRVYIYVYN